VAGNDDAAVDLLVRYASARPLSARGTARSFRFAELQSPHLERYRR
jgi:hypothetical protein